MCTVFVRRHVAALEKGQMFTTRDCLKYGSRAAVDKALSRMVRTEIITRLARGVFMKADWRSPRPSALAVATIKAQSFGRQIASHGVDLGHKMALQAKGNQEPTYIITGSSSSFHYGGTVINFKGACMRKHRSGESLAGQVIRALWQLGEQACTDKSKRKAASTCGRTDRQELRDSAAWMPAWLSDYFVLRQSAKRREIRLACGHDSPCWLSPETYIPAVSPPSTGNTAPVT